MIRYLIFGLLLLICYESTAQSEKGILYGTIELKNRVSYQGQIRWDGQESLWTDIFDAPKGKHPMQNLLSKAEARRANRESGDFRYGFMQLWEDKSPQQNFAFRCYFGDVTRLDVLEEGELQVVLKNGDKVILQAGRGIKLSDDVQIYDQDLGWISVKLRNIRSIVFDSAPEGYNVRSGGLIYGIVMTTAGSFEGYITWDDDECMGNDIISGYQGDKKKDIQFKNIATLTAEGDGSRIVLRSGRSMFLNNHDDVSSRNHGIFVRNQDFGDIKINWENFISATFFDNSVPACSYQSFPQTTLLRGSVFTKDEQIYGGEMVYDLDEMYNIEFLNGRNNTFEYFIPFRKIAAIVPQNDKFSLVKLKSGKQLILGGNGDVNGYNHGIVLLQEGGTAEYIAWKDIKRIEFE